MDEIHACELVESMAQSDYQPKPLSESPIDNAIDRAFIAERIFGTSPRSYLSDMFEVLVRSKQTPSVRAWMDQQSAPVSKGVKAVSKAAPAASKAASSVTKAVATPVVKPGVLSKAASFIGKHKGATAVGVGAGLGALKLASVLRKRKRAASRGD